MPEQKSGMNRIARTLTMTTRVNEDVKEPVTNGIVGEVGGFNHVELLPFAGWIQPPGVF